jgi:methionyl-tRNA formyltransferase
MKALAPDIVISLMFTDRIPPFVLGAFPGKVFNLHPSLLPVYRGLRARRQPPKRLQSPRPQPS